MLVHTYGASLMAESGALIAALVVVVGVIRVLLLSQCTSVTASLGTPANLVVQMNMCTLHQSSFHFCTSILSYSAYVLRTTA